MKNGIPHERCWKCAVWPTAPRLLWIPYEDWVTPWKAPRGSVRGAEGLLGNPPGRFVCLTTGLGAATALTEAGGAPRPSGAADRTARGTAQTGRRKRCDRRGHGTFLDASFVRPPLVLNGRRRGKQRAEIWPGRPVDTSARHNRAACAPADVVWGCLPGRCGRRRAGETEGYD
jgi:hypothetical protein